MYTEDGTGSVVDCRVYGGFVHVCRGLESTEDLSGSVEDCSVY